MREYILKLVMMKREGGAFVRAGKRRGSVKLNREGRKNENKGKKNWWRKFSQTSFLPRQRSWIIQEALGMLRSRGERETTRNGEKRKVEKKWRSNGTICRYDEKGKRIGRVLKKSTYKILQRDAWRGLFKRPRTDGILIITVLRSIIFCVSSYGGSHCDAKIKHKLYEFLMTSPLKIFSFKTVSGKKNLILCNRVAFHTR